MVKRRRIIRRSGLEDNIEAQLKTTKTYYEYEPKEGKISYTVPESYHKYCPDFIIKTKSGKEIIIEGKGIWDNDDRKKHLLIRQQHPNLDIRFVFSRSKARIRKGSKTTYADICEGKGRSPYKGIVWQYSDKLIPPAWLRE